MLARIAFALVLLLTTTWSGWVRAGDNIPPQLAHLGVTEHLDAQVPMDASFLDENGSEVRLGHFFGSKPTVLVLGYHSCPSFCSMVLKGLAESLREVSWTVGKEYEVVVVSIDPRDTPASAAKKRAMLVGDYGRSREGFHFLVGQPNEISKLTTAVGFEYEYDKAAAQYSHPAVIFVLTPGGRIARYLYGVGYEPKDVKLSLLEAANGHSLSTIDRFILFCYHYDPNAGKYVLVARRIMQLGGALTALVLGTFLAVMWRRERRKSAAATSPNPSASSTPSEAAV